MSIIQRIDMWKESLLPICLWCEHGFLIVQDGMPDWLICGSHAISGIKSKKVTAPAWHDPGGSRRGDKGDSRTYAPVMGADETCDRFSPIDVTSTKAKILDELGYLDDELSLERSKRAGSD